MRRLCHLLWLALSLAPAGAEPGAPYRLEAVDLKQRVIWGGESLEPEGGGLAFGGQDQDAEDGRARTRVRRDGQWLAIGEELRAGNPLQPFHERAWALRCEAKDLRAQVRAIFFDGLAEEEQLARVSREVTPRQRAIAAELDQLIEDLVAFGSDDVYLSEQAEIAALYLLVASAKIDRNLGGVSAADLRSQREGQIALELGAEALDAEPAARAVDCGSRRGEQLPGTPGGRGLVYDPKTKLYVLFGGDHLDYLTNDTWVFDPARSKWFQRHPDGAPPPRANHRLEALGDGRVRLSGGYTYTSNTDYLGGQYADLADGPWVYDIAADAWSGGDLVDNDHRIYRGGPFHPEFYLRGEKPDARAFAARLAALPANEWVATDPPYRPRLNRDWGSAVIDPDHDLLLRWSGGHSAHGGSDVPHFHFATNRWELPFPVEFPLGQLYSNTSYPRGFNYNRRPWITGHTYQNYQYDLPSKRMVKAGRPRHHYLYDPAVGDWVGRGAKPEAMCYDSCFYTLTLVSTPRGVICWDKDGRMHRFDAKAGGGRGQWVELELAGAKLAGAVVDNSTIAYDSKRDRVLVVTKPYGNAPFDGQVWSVDLKTNRVAALSPGGMERARQFAFIDRCVYDPDSDLVLMASYLDGAGDGVTRTPAFDCAEQRWVTLDLQYATGRRGERTTRGFPHGRSCGIMFDPKRRLIWGTDTDSQVYVLRLELGKADLQAL